MDTRGLYIAVTCIGTVLVAGIVLLTIYHPGDNTAAYAALGSLALALLSFLSSRVNANKLADQADKISENTEATRQVQQTAHNVEKMVDGQRTALEKTISKLEGKLERSLAENEKE